PECPVSVSQPRQGPGLWHLERGRIAPLAVRHACRRLHLPSLGDARGVRVRVTQSVIDGVESGRREIAEPGVLNRRRLARKYAETLPGRMARQIEEDVDAVRLHLSRQRRVVEIGRVPPGIAQSAQAPGDRIVLL